MNKYILIAATALTFAACTNEEMNTVPDGKTTLQVHAAIGAQTRASGTQWAVNDPIGISYTTESGASGTNIQYYATSTSGDFQPSGTPIYLEGNDTYTFSAYYPYSNSITADSKVISATTDASHQRPNIDFLYASGAEASKSDPKAKFQFSHCMSQITLTFKKDASLEENATMSTYTLGNIQLSGTFDTSTGTATTTTGEASSLTLDNAAFGASSSLILFPQTVTNLTLSVSVDENNYTATLSPGENGLQAGYNYAWNVTVKKTGLEISSANIQDWQTPDGFNGDVDATL